MDASSCPQGNFTDNMCPGDASNKCCLAAPFDEPSCEDAGGRCLDECACTGEVRTGLCGSQPASIRCCIEDELVDDCHEGENEDALPVSSVSADATEENDSLGTGTGSASGGDPTPLNPSSCPGGFNSNCNNGECVITCTNSGQGNNNNNNNNNGRKRRRRKRSTGEQCPENSTTDSQEDWQTIDLGNVCDCWTKADSDKAARVDKSKLEQYNASFIAASNKYNIPKEVLMALASRESRAGSALGLGDNKPGYGDHNHGFGLMQVDIRHHTVADDSDINNIDQGAGILADMLNKVKKKHPDWSEGWQLRGAIAAYNMGLKNVQTKSGIDQGSSSSKEPTTCSPCDGNYSWDTMQRARWLAAN